MNPYSIIDYIIVYTEVSNMEAIKFAVAKIGYKTLTSGGIGCFPLQEGYFCGLVRQITVLCPSAIIS